LHSKIREYQTKIYLVLAAYCKKTCFKRRDMENKRKALEATERGGAAADAAAAMPSSAAPPSPPGKNGAKKDSAGAQKGSVDDLRRRVFGDDADTDTLEEVARLTRGFSGREIAKLFTSLQTHICADMKGALAQKLTLTKKALIEVVKIKVAEHERTEEVKLQGYQYVHREVSVPPTPGSQYVGSPGNVRLNGSGSFGPGGLLGASIGSNGSRKSGDVPISSMQRAMGQSAASKNSECFVIHSPGTNSAESASTPNMYRDNELLNPAFGGIGGAALNQQNDFFMDQVKQASALGRGAKEASGGSGNGKLHNANNKMINGPKANGGTGANGTISASDSIGSKSPSKDAAHRTSIDI
jgi:hypothetical protein